MNAQTLIDETKKKVREINNGTFGEIFILYRQFLAAYELCEGNDEEIEDLKDIKNYLEEVYDETLDLIRTLDKIGRK